MNYSFVYNKIIKKAQERTKIEGYYEKHHILPKSLGGSNEKVNIVKLTAREHFICHWLLVKMFEKGTDERKKMLFALWRMKVNKNGKMERYINSRAYEKLRNEFSNSVGEITKKYQSGKGNSQYGKKWYTNYINGESRRFSVKPDKTWILGRNLFRGEFCPIKSKKVNDKIFKGYKKKIYVYSIDNLEKLEISNIESIPNGYDTFNNALYKINERNARMYWDKFNSGGYNSVNEFSKFVNISEPALINKFKKYIKIYLNEVKEGISFKSNIKYVGKYE